MSFFTKILITIGLLIVLITGGCLFYNQVQLSKQQKAIEEQIVKQKELADNITRSMNEYATKKDIEQYIKDSNINLNAIKEDLKKLQADIIAINTIIANSKGYTGSNLPSSGTGQPNPGTTTTTTVDCGNGTQVSCPDPFGYMARTQLFKLNEDFDNTSVPIGTVGFSAWQSAPWSVSILPRSYQVSSVVGVDENRRHYFYNKFTIKVDNKSYDIKINEATTKEEYPESKISYYNPRLYFNGSGSINLSGDINLSVGPSFSFISYGKYKVNPEFSILGAGVNYAFDNRKFMFVLSPINYNIGAKISGFNNTYIGPTIGTNFVDNHSLGVGLNVGF